MYEPTDDPVYVPRVLDVQKGKLCYIVGTVYMDMPLKPNVLVDLGKEVRFSGFVRHSQACLMHAVLSKNGPLSHSTLTSTPIMH